MTTIKFNGIFSADHNQQEYSFSDSKEAIITMRNLAKSPLVLNCNWVVTDISGNIIAAGGKCDNRIFIIPND